MEETELEEGEACYHNEDDNSAIDPDITLSYIDEKLQDVLGHLQKDFEGGVSAENLGAKFGGYGSFLPTYRRSPSWSHLRSPPEVYNRTSKSPNNIQLEGGCHNSFSSSSASLSVRPGKASSNAMPLLRPPSGNDRVNQDVSAFSNHGEELASKFVVQKSTSFQDQKTLKFRIKVGTDNLSTQKNAEIYSGLGLDVSPSSSSDDSPADSEGLYHGPRDIPDESPTSILQIMTAVSFGGGLLLSPLSDHVMHLPEKERLLGKIVNKASQGNSQMVVNGSDLKMTNGKVLGEKKPKSLERSAVLVEPSNSSSKDIGNGTVVASKREIDIDTLACEELVSSTLKLPLLSNSYSDVTESVKDPVKLGTNSKAATKSQVTIASFFVVAEKESSDPVASLENGTTKKLNRRTDSSGMVWESRKQDCADENSVYHKKEVNHKEEKAEFSIETESFVSEEKKSLNTNVVDSSKQKAVQKVTSYNEDGLKLAPGVQQLSSGGKKKSKEGQGLAAQGMEFLEDGPIINSCVVPKSNKTSKPNGLVSKSDAEGLKKGNLKVADRHRKFFGELELEQEDVEIASEEMPSLQTSKDSEFVEKRSTSKSNGTLKERPIGKTTGERSVSGDHPRLSSNMPRLAVKVPNPNAAPTMAAPLVKEDWVCCDKCQAWRLLPLGTNPESLPEKWQCSMLNWLPGMNHCSIGEEETTNALMALYQTQASTAQSQHNQHAHPGGTLLGIASGDARRSTEGSQNSGLQATDAGGKKKFGSKDVTNPTNLGSTIQVSDQKKNFQEASKTRNLNEVDLSPSADEFGYQHEGDTIKSHIKNKRENDVDATRASKKMKTEDVRLKDENCLSAHAGASSKVGHSSNSGFSNSASVKDPHGHSSCSRDTKGDLKQKSVSSEKPEGQISITSDVGSLHMAKCGNDPMKKRKGNEHQRPSDNDVPLPSEGHHSQGSRGSLEETNEYDYRKEKKGRVLKSEGKDSNRSKDTVVTGKKAARVTKDQQMRQDLGSTPSRRSIDATDSLRRDLGSAQPSVVATSSSSKVSGSHRSKTSHGEMKGSPVESVSSSPLRIANTDKFSQARRNIASKDDLQDAGLFATASPRRSINGEDIGRSDQSGKMKDDSINVIDNGSLESSVIDFQGRDLGHVSSVKCNAECTSFSHFAAQSVPDCDTNPLDQNNQTAPQTETSEQSRDERKRNDNQYTSNVSHSKKSGKGFSSRFKEKTRGSRARFDNGKIKDADSFDECLYEEKMKAGKNKFVEKSSINSDRIEKSYISKKDSAGNVNREICKEESHHSGPSGRPDVISSQDTTQNVQQQSDNERSSRKLLSDGTGVEDSGRMKSHSLQPSVRCQSEATTRFQPSSELKKENGERAFEHEDTSKVSKQSKKAEKQNGSQPVNMKNLSPSTRRGQDLAPSPIRKDSSSQAVTNAVKEAKDLKHLADRLKNSGSTESTGLYFQAALKFLHGASLLESSGSENAKHNEMIHIMQMYSSTAKLCGFCAHEYEKSKDMAAAALAYKCMEVAYMRIIYTSHTNASRDRNELQAALQIIPTGESPSSSASDIDNLNNPEAVDKAVIPKGVTSPQVAGNHVLTARNRSSFMRQINFAQDVNFAMEASRKSRTRFGEAQSREGISSVKRALDFNFQDVDGLLRLVRVAMEAINR